MKNSASPWRSARRWLAHAGLAALWALGAAAPAAAARLTEFTVTVGTAPGAESSISPGEKTTLRITLTNASAGAYTGVNFNKVLASEGNGNLLVDGTATTSYTSGGFNGTVTLPAIGSTLGVTLAGLTVPARSGTSDDGQCTIDIPVKAVSSDGQASTQT